jgi:putative MATE family efflux protein
MIPLFADKDFYRNLFTIALPIMFQNLINALVNMLDTVMIGRLGTVEIAAVGMGNQIFFLYTLTLFGVCSGGSIFTAQFWGRRDIPGLRKNTGFCMALSLLAASLFTLGAAVFPERLIGIYTRDPAVILTGTVYLKTLAPAFIPVGISTVLVLTLRSVEKVRLAMVSTLIALSLNGILNYFLIFGIGPFPALGVRGASIATVIARFTELAILLSVSYARRYPPAGTLREMTAFTLSYVQRYFRICLPVILNEIIWSTGITVQNIIFGRTHTGAIAAFNITNTVSQLTWTVFMGLGNGVAVLIGKKIGERNEKTARDYASRIARFSPLVSLGAILILYPLSRALPLVFKVDQEVFTLINLMFIILCCSYPFRAFNMAMVVGICRAGGDTLFCVLYDVVIMWVIALPLAAAASFIFHAPVWLIFLCINIEEPVKMLLGLWRLKTGKWLHYVTEGL